MNCDKEFEFERFSYNSRYRNGLLYDVSRGRDERHYSGSGGLSKARCSEFTSPEIVYSENFVSRGIENRGLVKERYFSKSSTGGSNMSFSGQSRNERSSTYGNRISQRPYSGADDNHKLLCQEFSMKCAPTVPPLSPLIDKRHTPSQSGRTSKHAPNTEPKLRAHGIVDWDSVPDNERNARHKPRSTSAGSKDQVTHSSLYGSDSSRRTSLQHRAISAKNNERDVESNFERPEGRKRRFSGCEVDMKSDAAVGMPLDEMIIKNNIKYCRARPTRGENMNDRYSSLSYRNRNSTNRVQQRDQSIIQDEDIELLEMSLSPRCERKSTKGSDLRAVVIDGSSVAFEYGGNLHFDWMGIHICVEFFVNLGCSDVTVIVPEERLETYGMSKNEHLINALKESRYLYPAWEGRNDKIFVAKTASRKDAIIISNDTWKSERRMPPRLKYLKNLTIGYVFVSPEKIKFFKSVAGKTVEEILRY